MKKILTTLLTLFPFLVFSQYVSIPTHYDAEHTAHHILKGHIKMYIQDTIKYVIERKVEKYIIDYEVTSNQVKPKLNKILKKGKPEFSGRTNGGYIFTIVVIDRNDETKILNYCTFHVDEVTQKINEIEILLGE